MRKVLLILCLAILGSTFQANANNKYYAALKLVASTGGGGTVYASTSNTDSSSSHSASSTASGNTSTNGGNVTFYAFATADATHTFKGWSSSDNGTITSTSNPYTVNVAASSTTESSPSTTTLYAVFQKNPDFYASATAVADASKGTAYASFTEGTYTSSTATGSKTGNSGAAKADITAYYKAIGSGNYAFTGWSETEGGAIVSTDNPYARTITSSSTDSSNPASKTLYANFAAADPYHFSVTATTTNATAGSASATLSDGTTVNGIGSAKNTATFTATANQGYSFAGWGESASATSYVSTTNPYQVELTNNAAGSTVSKTLYAFFDEYNDPLQPSSSNPAKNSTVTSSLTTVSVTYSQAINTQNAPSLRIYDKAEYDEDDWCDPVIYSTGTPTLSNGNKTLTFTLENPLQTPGVYYFWIGAQRLTFADGQKNTEVLIPFTYSESQMTLQSTSPANAQPAKGPLSAFTITYAENITNTPAANGLKVYAMSEYRDYAETQTYDYLLATSSSATVNGNQVTYNFSSPIDRYGSFKVKLDYGALESNGAKSPKIDQDLIIYADPIITPAPGSEVASLDSISLVYNGVALNVDQEAFGSVAGLGTCYIEKYKGGNWIEYCVAKLTLSSSNGSRALIFPTEVNDKGWATDKFALTVPGRYRVVVPYGSLYSSLYTTTNPAWQYINQPLDIEYTIPGDESMDYLRPISTSPADYGQVSNQFSTFSMTYSMDVNTLNEASNMSVYTKTGTKLASASSVSKSADNRTVTYTLDTPITTKDTLTVVVATSAFGGDGWLNDQVKRHVIVAERFNVTGSIDADAWKIKSIKFDIDVAGHDTILVAPLQQQLSIYKYGDNGEGVSTSRHLAPNQDVVYDKTNHIRTMNFLESGYLLGEGSYYVDIPTGFFRCHKTASDENWIYNEATRVEFSLGAQPATTFTVSPTSGSQLSSITTFTINISDCDSISKAGIFAADYFYVSKDGADPIRFAVYNAERGDPSEENSTTGTVTTDVMTMSKTGVTYKIYAEGFKTPIVNPDGSTKATDVYGWEDTYGYSMSGTYTITIPAKTFKIDGSYYNTDLSFTYVVQNSNVEKRKFTGGFDILPSATDTIVNVFDDLQEITIHFRDADEASITSIQANVKGTGTSTTYLTLQSYEQIDETTYNLIMAPQSVTEHQDDYLTLTFTGDFQVNGSRYVIDNTNNNMDANHEPITQTWSYMTLEKYLENNVVFSPAGGVLTSLSKITVTPRSEYKFYSNFKWPEIPVVLNGNVLDGYAFVGNSTGNSTAGSLTLKKDDKTVTLKRPGTYTIKVPAGYFPLQHATNYSQAWSKEETLTFTIEVDVNQDGSICTLSDAAKLIHYLLIGDQRDEADVNGDGVVNIADLEAIKTLLLNK